MSLTPGKVLHFLEHRPLVGAEELTDGQLLERFVSRHESAALEALVARHGGLVWSACRRRLPEAADAEDAFQAVFLVLVRKAGTLDRRPSLAGWLYGVAHRVALKARANRWRRERQERQVADMDHAAAAVADGSNLQDLLDVELNRLPEKYRNPIVLCYLEGKTHAQAARELGWSLGSMSKLLARGCELLRERLTRQGVALSGAALAAALTAPAAAVPPALVAATLHSAECVLAGTTAAAGVSAGALALTDALLHTMFVCRLKMTAALLLVFAVGTSAGIYACHALVTGVQPASADAAPQVAADVAPQFAIGADAPPGKEAEEPPEFTSAIALPIERRLTQTLNAAGDLLDDGEWAKACRALQGILDAEQDSFVELRVPGRRLVVSVRAEANRVLGAAPAEARAEYERTYGAAAAAMLKEARANKDDPELLGRVAQRYANTTAGAEAAVAMAVRMLHDRDYQQAAQHFDRLRARPDADRVLGENWYWAAQAYRYVGDASSAAQAWKHFQAVGETDLRVRDKLLNLEELKTALDNIKAAGPPPALADWPTFRGDARGTALSSGGAPTAEASWSASTLPDRVEEKAWAETYLDQTLQKRRDAGNRVTILPALFPVASKGRIIYRTQDGVYAVNLKAQDKLLWYGHADGGLHALFSDIGKKAILTQWADQYRQLGPHGLLFENSVLGALSTDGVRAFAIDDLALPPHPSLFAAGFGQLLNFGALGDQVKGNSLTAYHLESGKLIWALGGRLDQSSLKNSFFLGAPLPHGDKLYVLNEKDGELRLLCLQARDTFAKAIDPEILWTQTLGYMKDKLPLDTARRTQAAHLAVGGGIMVCPTNAGALLGVDLSTRNVVWSYPYHEPDPRAAKKPVGQPAPGGAPEWRVEWQSAAPAIVGNRVIFTAPDAASLHCLDLRTGKHLWKAAPQEEDLYFAGVYSDRVLIVGKSDCRALDLITGKRLWRLEGTGMPSGQGTAVGGSYFLPVSAAAVSKDSKEPEILAIDLARGSVQARIKTPQRDGKAEVPGNLLFHDGAVISQSLNRIVAYPQVRKEP